jgi:KTSC domain
MVRAARLASSMIERVQYDEDARELMICFRTGRRYIYSAVPRAIFEALRSAGSAGRVFNLFIRGKFPCREEGRRFRPAA